MPPIIAIVILCWRHFLSLLNPEKAKSALLLGINVLLTARQKPLLAPKTLVNTGVHLLKSARTLMDVSTKHVPPMNPLVALRTTFVPSNWIPSSPGGGRVAGPPNLCTFLAVAANLVKTAEAVPPPIGRRQIEGWTGPASERWKINN